MCSAKTQELYNNISRVDTGQNRSHGEAYHLKVYHNRIKRLLIEAFARNADSLFDLGTGRGGDLLKWQHANIKFVQGIDSSPNSLDEARYRFRQLRSSSSCKVVLNHVENFGFEDFENKFAPFTAVSSMFALHYFFETERALHQTICNVSNMLQSRGVFFGCVPHGLRVLQKLDGAGSYKTDFLNLSLKHATTIACFGSVCEIAIKDTVTEQQSSEFLVFENVLTTVAAMYGLYPIINYPQPLMDALCTEDAKKVFKHFDPQFSKTPEQQEASSLFCTFAFIKR